MSVNPYRLPQTVVPSAYRLHLTPDLETFTFVGRVEIDVDVRESVTTFSVNALELVVEPAVVEVAGQRFTSAAPTYSSEFQTATFTFDEALPLGPAVVDIAFTGILNDQLHGFYRSTYTDPQGTSHIIATTQFESHDARRAFPCWDDPAYKATYQVNLTVPAHLQAYSNSPVATETDLGNGLRHVSFAPTMKMSTYLVAFVVGPFETTDVTVVRGVPIRIIYPIGKGGLSDVAMETAVHAIEFFTDYFGIAYPGDKLDMIAVPDFAAGAMENLGLVTYRDTALLVDPATASHSAVVRVAEVVNHEIAHMWFGDLVTMDWWEGIWLNEAFATFMESLCSDHFRPEWKTWVEFNPQRDMAFGVDGLHSTRAIEYTVIAPDDCRGMFDILTYTKGCAVLRMLEQYLGAEVFRDGIRLYLKKHAYANTVTQDLWDALEESSGEPVGEIMNTWILQGGHPLITVANGTISQKPFSYLPPQEKSAIASSWVVPVLSREISSDNVAKQLLREASAPLVTSGTVVVNAGGSGFYRTAYGAPELAALSAHLDDLDELERAVLFADTWAAILAGNAPLGDLFQLARGLVHLDEPSTWAVVTTALGMIDRVASPEARAEFAPAVHRLLRPVFDRLGWDKVVGESAQAGELRAAVIATLGVEAGDEDIIAEALRRFDAGEVKGDLANAIVAITAQQNRPGTVEEFDRRRAAAITPQDEQLYLFGLSRIPSVETALATYERCYTDIRTQDAPFLIMALLNSRVVGEAVWRTLSSEIDRAFGYFPVDMQPRMISGVSGLFLSPELAAEVRAFHEAHPVKTGALTVTQALDRLDRGVLFGQRVGGELAATLASAGN